MKKLINRAVFSIGFMVCGLLAAAQDKAVDVNVNVNKGSNWYQQPWVWIIGAAVFILILVAILRGNKD